MVQKIRKETKIKPSVTKNKLNPGWRIKGRNKIRQLKQIVNKLSKSRNPRDQKIAEHLKKEMNLS